MGKEYKVETRTLGGLKGKIFRKNDVVTEVNFPDGNCAKLVSAGFLSEVGESIEDFTVAELKGKLTEMEVEHSLSKKKELFDLYVSSKVK
tara:strand:+ start:3129 stop:3398 length:270 start_codon:yes stop_codon:yes gene_type:complete